MLYNDICVVMDIIVIILNNSNLDMNKNFTAA